MKNLFILIFVMLLAFIIFSPSVMAGTLRVTNPKETCGSFEKWNFPEESPKDWHSTYVDFMEGGSPYTRAFGEATHLKEKGENEVEKSFGVFWTARVLYEREMFHYAALIFSSLTMKPITHETLGIQLAALECLNKIQILYPRIYLSRKFSQRLTEYKKVVSKKSWAAKQLPTLWKSAVILVLHHKDNRKNTEDLKDGLRILRGSGIFRKLAEGITATRTKHYKFASKRLASFVKETEQLPPELATYLDAAHITLARTQYKLGNYKEATINFQKVSKNSNFLIRALVENAQSHLVAGDFQKAIGAAMHLDSNLFRDTFTPETYLIIAMTFNDLCQYPASMAAVKKFVKRYKSSFNWLKTWWKDSEKGKVQPLEYYQTVVKVLKQEDNSIPNPVVSEWIRSEIFLSYQDEINLAFAEPKRLRTFRKEMISHSKKIGKDKPEFRKKLIRGRRYLKRLARIWKLKTKVYREDLVRTINADIHSRNKRMLRRLVELRQLARMVRAEIYSEASQDIVFKGANPEYNKFKADQELAEAKKLGASGGMSWGETSWSEDDQGEIWEDELGSMETLVFDNCSAQDKFYEIKQARNSHL